MSDFKNKVVYQIYPKSFYDSNNDGHGDLKGITEKLDYLAYLGVDYLWLNPIFISPQKDSGYDITDYRNIDPKFGTMEDLEELIAEAEKRNIYLMFDMVFNHTSTTHEWFQKALQGEEKYQNYYIFKKPVEGRMPNHWESKFGGPVWEYIKEMDAYYLHLFDKTQADLNWQNPQVRKEMTDIVNFWIKKGVRGFRFDVINLIDKVSFEEDDQGIGKRMYTDGPLVHQYIREMNQQSFGKYENMLTVGEMSATSLKNCIAYTNPKKHELNMTFNFHHLKVDYKNKEKWTVMAFDFKELKQLFHTWQTGMQRGGGWNALFWNCHDQPRSLSRFGDDKRYPKESAKMLATAIHLQRGTPYIYQGEEIGMTNAYFTEIDQYRDVESINFYYILKEQGKTEEEIHEILQAKSRDNARTPMQWDSTGGFSKTKPWIDMNTNYPTVNVENCLKDPDSIFHYYCQLIQLRKTYPVISEGDYLPLFEEHPQVYAFKRTYHNESLIVLNNFYGEAATLHIDRIQAYEVLISNYKNHELQDELILRPYESIALYKKSEKA